VEDFINIFIFTIGLIVGLAIHYFISKKDREGLKNEITNNIAQLAANKLQEAKDNLNEIDNTRRLEVKNKEDRLDNEENKITDLLTSLQTHLIQATTTWKENHNSLTQSVEDLTKSNIKFGESLSNSQLQGELGEETLELLLESAGFIEDVNYKMQAFERDLEGRELKPDCYVFLPDDAVIVIDSKAPMKAYKEALDTDDPEKKKELLAEHAENVLKHAKDLSRKDYSAATNKKTADHVLMYMPHIAPYLAALEAMPDLDEKARKMRVSIVPSQLLYSVLKTIWLTWQEKQMHENSEEVIAVVKELQKRLRVFYVKHFKHMGVGLNKVVEKYNNAVASWDRNTRTQLDRIEELLATNESEGIGDDGADLIGIQAREE
jgi:DNA recombination protein RmuC